jgi:hypothetical protein
MWRDLKKWWVLSFLFLLTTQLSGVVYRDETDLVVERLTESIIELINCQRVRIEECQVSERILLQDCQEVFIERCNSARFTVRDSEKVEIKNCTGSGEGRINGDNCITIIYSKDVLVENCRLFEVIAPEADAHGVCVATSSRDIIIRNCEIYNCSGDGVQVQHYDFGVRPVNVLIENNLFYSTYLDDEDWERRGENAIDLKDCDNVIIRKNTMYGFRRSHGSDGTAVVIHYDADNVTIEENIIYNSIKGIRVRTARTTNQINDCVIRRNVIFDCNFPTNVGASMGICCGWEQLVDFKVYHNTFYNVKNPIRITLQRGYPRNMEVINNLIVNCNWSEETEDELNLQENSTYSWVVEYNGFFNSGEARGRNAVTGNDPLLADPAQKNFQLQPNSPCIDRGKDIGLPFYGRAPDLGAYEYNVEVAAAPFLVRRKHNCSYPNPFNPECYIPVNAKSKKKNVKCKIYNILGQLVKEIEWSKVHGLKDSRIYWDGRDSRGLEVPAGVYFYEMGGEGVKRIVVLK